MIVYLLSATYRSGETEPVTAFETREAALDTLGKILTLPILSAAAEYSVSDIALVPSKRRK
jgi:hypothetical protein